MCWNWQIWSNDGNRFFHAMSGCDGVLRNGGGESHFSLKANCRQSRKLWHTTIVSVGTSWVAFLGSKVPMEWHRSVRNDFEGSNSAIRIQFCVVLLFRAIRFIIDFRIFIIQLNFDWNWRYRMPDAEYFVELPLIKWNFVRAKASATEFEMCVWKSWQQSSAKSNPFTWSHER